MKVKKIIPMLALVCVMMFGGIFLTACGGGNSLTINFESNGGTSCSSIEYTQDSTLKMPNDPTREDYLFGGWYEDNTTFEKEFNQANINSYLENDSLTLYAKWLKKVNLVFISDDNFDNIYLDSLDIELPTPMRDGYTFDCWCIDQELTKPYTTETIVEPNNLNEVCLYPRWKETKVIYYYNDIDAIFEKVSDSVAVGESITLYQPKVPYYHFDGWFYDSAYTEPVPNRISNDMLKSENNVLYAKFTEKEIESINVIGTIKTEYEYGESFDVGAAKLLVHYIDEQFEDEVVEITDDMLIGFYPQDIGYENYYQYNHEPDIDEAYYGSVNFRILNHNGTQIARTTNGVGYKVKTDIETFTLNKDIVYEFGEYISLAEKGIVVSYTDEQGEKTEPLTDTNLNYYFTDLSTNKIGTFTFSLRFHYRTLEFEYTVNDANIISGYVEKRSSDDPILLNSRTSLLDQEIYLINEDTNVHIRYDGPTQDQIVEDIDTTIAGWGTAKIVINEREIFIDYYVVDLNQIQELRIAKSYRLQETVEYGFDAIITMEDDTMFEHYFSYTTFSDDDYIIENVDTSTPGIKYAKVYFFGKVFEVEYMVKE